MKCSMQSSVTSMFPLVPQLSTGSMTAIASEPFIYGGYLEGWFRSLKLSKQYIQNCRTGLFGSQGAANTFKLFGSIEHFTMRDWWLERGCENFGRSLSALKIRLVSSQRKEGGCRITVDAADQVPDDLVGEEFKLLIQQIRSLEGPKAMLSSVPRAWSIYRSRITPGAIQLHLDVLEAYDNIMHSAPGTKLWRIGEQMRLNPKATTTSSDSANEKTAKHIVMGQTVSLLVRKGRGLVANACEGLFPKY